MTESIVRELPDRPLDIIGDVHGEFSALRSLLRKLGYEGEQGRHPDGRVLVFVGDLVDRGPHSASVLHLVKGMVEAGNALCVVGNHELNALRDDPEKRRPGEGWWYGREERGAVPVDPGEKRDVLMPFLRSLPIALERDDLRVVHACWHEDSIGQLARRGAVIDHFERFESEFEGRLVELRRRGRQAFERAGYAPADRYRRDRPVELIPELARAEEEAQMANPVKVLTSGVERVAEASFYASEKWRMVERVRWWDEYADTPVVVGHYWRRYAPEGSGNPSKSAADMFGDVAPNAWLGPAGNVMCVDYSVGYRNTERAARLPAVYQTCLGALRVPEWKLVFDDERPSLSAGTPAAPGDG